MRDWFKHSLFPKKMDILTNGHIDKARILSLPNPFSLEINYV